MDFERIPSDSDFLKELKQPADVLLTTCKFSLIDDLSKRSNNYTKLLHILSYIFGLINNSRTPSVKSVSGFRHNTLLHRQKGESSNAPLIYSASPLQGQELNPSPEEFHSPQENTAAFLSCTSRSKTVILPTAVVWVLNHSTGNCIQARAILDSGSMCNIVMLDFANKLGAPQNRITIPISSLGGNKTTVIKRYNNKWQQLISYNLRFSGCLKN
ncbi:hypothetical protein TNCV_2211321 [Trichonephila clavipes]|nr:hypothetical protein TNCV_2211321 [Trichonephila clavipes]